MSKALLIKSKNAPVVELDSEARAAYVRFSKRKIKTTRVVESSGAIVTIDLDAKGEVVGVELIGVKQFGITPLLKKARVKLPPKHILEKTRYVPAELQAA